MDIVSAETALYIQKLYEDMEQAKEIHDKLHDDELAVLDELKELEDKKDDLIYSKEELEEEYLEHSTSAHAHGTQLAYHALTFQHDDEQRGCHV